MRLEKNMADILLDEKGYDQLLSQTQDIVFEWNYITKELYHSGIFAKKFNCLPDYKDFPRCAIVPDIVHPDDLDTFYKTYSVYDTGAISSVGEFRIKDIASAEYEWYRSSSTAMTDANNNIVKVLGILSNIDMQKKEAIFAKNLAMRDGLTGVYNRIATEQLIRQYTKKASSGGAMFIVDIDNFKGLNDTMGHQFGDNVLINISKSIGQLFRKGDIVGRLGGDEFIVFMADIDEKYNIKRRARDLVAAIKSPFEEQSPFVEVSGSVGIAVFPKDGETFEDLYKNADIALYRSKSYGKNRYTMFDINFAQDDIERNRITAIEKSCDFSLEDIGLATASDSVVFICDASNKRLMFLSNAAKEALQLTDADLGKKCYHAFHHRSGPCEHCTSRDVSFDGFISSEFDVQHLNKTFLLREKLIKWKGITAQIGFATDITKSAHAHKLADSLKADIRKYRNLIKQISDGMFEYNAVSDLLSVSLFDYKKYNLESDTILFEKARDDGFSFLSHTLSVSSDDLAKLCKGFFGECEVPFEISILVEGKKVAMLVTPSCSRDSSQELLSVIGTFKALS